VLIRTCLCLITRRATDANAAQELLLGFKKRGFGAGRWVGLGGHVEDGEDSADAAVREVREETGLIVAPSSLAHMATLRFAFPARPAWDQTAEVYLTTEFAGAAAESDEVIPRWFAASALPFDQMWDDARYWVPAVLAGRRVSADVVFAADCATVASIDPSVR
jgi:8-oxo-dGTP diphosphatase